MEHDDLFTVAVAQEMSHTDLDDGEIVRRMRALYGLSYVDAVSAVAATACARTPRPRPDRPHLKSPRHSATAFSDVDALVHERFAARAARFHEILGQLRARLRRLWDAYARPESAVLRCSSGRLCEYRRGYSRWSSSELDSIATRHARGASGLSRSSWDIR